MDRDAYIQEQHSLGRSYAQLGRELGISRQRVSEIAHKHRNPGRTRGKGKRWAKYEQLLGVLSDKELAVKLGITTSAVVRKRIRMGIAPITSSRERDIQRLFIAQELGGKDYQQYIPCEFGVIDVLTSDTIYEVKACLTSQSIKHAVGQLLCYRSQYPNHSMALVFGEGKLSSNLLLHLLKNLGIELVKVIVTSSSSI